MNEVDRVFEAKYGYIDNTNNVQHNDDDVTYLQFTVQ